MTIMIIIIFYFAPLNNKTMEYLRTKSTTALPLPSLPPPSLPSSSTQLQPVLNEGTTIAIPPIQPNVCVQCEKQDELVILRCGHACHRTCLDTWFKSVGTRSCPRCRVSNSDLFFSGPQETFFRVTHIPEYDIEYRPVTKRVRPDFSLLALLLTCLVSGSSYTSATSDTTVYPLVGVLLVWSSLTTMLRYRAAKQAVSSLKMVQAAIPAWLGSRINVDFFETLSIYILQSVLNISMLAAFAHSAASAHAINLVSHFTLLATGFVAAWQAIWPTVRLIGELGIFSLFGILKLIQICIPFDPTLWLVRAAQRLP